MFWFIVYAGCKRIKGAFLLSISNSGDQ